VQNKKSRHLPGVARSSLRLPPAGGRWEDRRQRRSDLNHRGDTRTAGPSLMTFIMSSPGTRRWRAGGLLGIGGGVGSSVPAMSISFGTWIRHLAQGTVFALHFACRLSGLRRLARILEAGRRGRSLRPPECFGARCGMLWWGGAYMRGACRARQCDAPGLNGRFQAVSSCWRRSCSGEDAARFNAARAGQVKRSCLRPWLAAWEIFLGSLGSCAELRPGMLAFGGVSWRWPLLVLLSR